jgi:hypothetical protein
MTGADPLQAVRVALEAAGCGPRGEPWKFTARCPAHDDAKPSLSVAEGADRRAVVHCHAGCDTRDVLDALGLRWADLFPAGHRHGPRPRPQRRGARTAAAVLMEGLTVAGYQWNALIAVQGCPYCDAPTAWLRVTDLGGVEADCTEGCSSDDLLRALECRVAIAEATR